jgi:ElaB/YqjD/DUF883 family membrane-anchored ribosome-binding protein
MLTVQKKFTDYLSLVKSELEKINFPIQENENLIKVIENTELLVPIIGAFSAGKSSLINTFIENEVLPVGITPETSLATELRFSQNERVEAVKSDDNVIQYKMSDFDVIKTNAREYKFIRVFLNSDKIKSIEPLILVDMPGFNSPLDLHNQAIINYINIGVHYIVLTSVEEGNITRSMMLQLSDIQEYGRDFSFFLSKSNLRADQEVNEIKNKIEEQLNEFLDINKNIIPIGNSSNNSFENVIRTIEPEELFSKLYQDELKQNYMAIIENINVSIGALQKGKSENESTILELNKSIENIIVRRDKMLGDVQSKYSDKGINSIIDSVGKNLSNSVEELSKSAMSGGQESLSQNISEIVRHTLITKLKSSMDDISSNIINEFAIEMKNLNANLSSYSISEDWLANITTATKKMFASTNDLLTNMVKNRKAVENTSKLFQSVTTVLAVTTTVLAPILEIVIIFLPNILSAIFGAAQKKKQEEEIKNHLLTNAIPSIKREIRGKLQELFNENVNTLIQQIGEKFEEELKEKREAIQKMQEEKQNNVYSIEEEINKYSSARDEITKLANKYIFISRS